MVSQLWKKIKKSIDLNGKTTTRKTIKIEEF